MNIYDLFIFSLISISIIHLWNCSEFFSFIRNYIKNYFFIKKPFLCVKCNSFWFGLLLGFFINPFNNIIFCGLYSYFISNLLCKYTNFFE